MNVCGWSVNWGSVPDWIAAIGTVGAFGLAVWLYRKNLQDRRSDQARFVHPLMSEAPALYDKGEAFYASHFDSESVGYGLATSLGVSANGSRWKALQDLCVVEVAVENNSQEVVTDIEARIVDLEDDPLAQEAICFLISLGPGEKAYVTAAFEASEAITVGADVNVLITFTDAVGIQWVRALGKPVRRST